MVDSALLKNIEYSSEQDSSSDEFELSHQPLQDTALYSSAEDCNKNGIAKRNLRKRLQSSQSLSDASTCKSNETLLRRQPTRRPDPTTFNRNAIMARENRKKKKEYVEQLEGKVGIYKNENKKLRKMLKQQFKMVEKLSHERSYLRSILLNKSQIMSLVKVVKDAKIPLSSSELNITPTNSGPATQSNNGLDDIEPFDTLQPRTDIWDDIPLFNSDFLNDTSSNISDEHNYFNSNNMNPGVCLHVSGSNISLEFCASCHDKANSSWLEI